jgi:Ice-binding-like/Secretion system C-terminal sorting domain
MKIKLIIWLSLGWLYLLPHLLRCQAPSLGTSSNFALFTSVGAFNNSVASMVEGDIGVDNGALNGFPPGILYGYAFTADPTTIQAAIDINVAYNYLVSKTCDTVLGVNIGNGQTLTPRVYCIGAAAALSGDLILDGKGNANSLFFINIDGALSVDSFSRIVLINNAAWCNVYWQVNGAFALGKGAVLRGTIINNGAISLLENSNLIGRSLSIAGAISLHNITATNDCTSLVPLPLDLALLSVQCNNRKNILQWSYTEASIGNIISIDKSTDAVHWKTIGTVISDGKPAMPSTHSFVDPNPPIVLSYYRLKWVNMNGANQYSNVISNNNCIKKATEIKIYPNPTTGIFNLYTEGTENKIISVSVFNSNGTLQYQSSKITNTINLSDKQAGFYVISIQLENEIIYKRIVLMR